MPRLLPGEHGGRVPGRIYGKPYSNRPRVRRALLRRAKQPYSARPPAVLQRYVVGATRRAQPRFRHERWKARRDAAVARHQKKKRIHGEARGAEAFLRGALRREAAGTIAAVSGHMLDVLQPHHRSLFEKILHAGSSAGQSIGHAASDAGAWLVGQEVNRETGHPEGAVTDAAIKGAQDLANYGTERQLHPNKTAVALANLVVHPQRTAQKVGAWNARQSAAQSVDPARSVRALEAPVEVGRALIEHPSAIPKTGKDLLSYAIGTPAAVASAAVDPVGTVKALSKDYSRRYGPLVQGDAKAFRERIGKEGAAPELVDIATVGGAEGAIAGRSLKRAAGHGALGKRLERAVTEPRPPLRITGGHARPQESSPNLFRLVGQRGHDVVRRRAFERRARRHPDEVPGMVPLQGEVVAATRTGQRRLQRIETSKVQSRHFQRFQNEQVREINNGAVRALGKLSKRQRGAVFHTLQGLVPLEDPARAVEALRARRARVVETYQETHPGKLPKEAKVLDELVKHADEIFTPALREFHAGELARGERIGHVGVADSTAEARRYRPQADQLGIPYDYEVMRNALKRRFTGRLRRAPDAEAAKGIKAERDQAMAELEQQKPELDRQFVEKVSQAARREGLPEPVYVQHFKHKTDVEGRAARAMGGRRAMAAPMRSELRLFRSGRAQTSAEAYVQSLARATKRKHNWAVVADQAELHSFPVPDAAALEEVFGHGHVNPEQLTLDEWKTLLEHRGLNPKDYAFWNPGRMRSSAARRLRGEPETRGGQEPRFDEETRQMVGDAFSETADSTVKSAGWKLIPREVYNEIHSAVQHHHVAGRLVDKVQSITAQGLLGTNPAWLQIQGAANLFLTGIAVAGNVSAFVKGPLWFRRLPPELQEASNEMFGVGVAGAHGRPVHLGAAADGGLVNWYRALRETTAFKVERAKQRVPGVRRVPLNPIKLIFEADRFQNAYFKKVVFYNKVKRETFNHMAKESGQLWATQQRIMHVIDLGPEQRMEALIRDKALFEKAAEHVNEVLGDYVRYTARERATLRRAILFYGFMRYSLRTLFYTMPVKHPLVMGVIAKLAQLHKQEVDELLGGPDTPWAYSKIFLSKDRSIDLARLNPVANPLVSISTEGIKGVGGFISPAAQIALDQLYGTSLYTGRQFRVGGSPETNPDPNAGARTRIVLNELGNLVFPYRAAEQGTQPGGSKYYSEDTLLGSPRPIKYKSAEKQAEERKAIAQAPALGRAILQQLEPFLPRRDTTAATAKRIRDAKAKKRRGGSKANDPLGIGGGTSTQDPLGIGRGSSSRDPLGLSK